MKNWMILAGFCVAVFTSGCGKPIVKPGETGGAAPAAVGTPPLTGAGSTVQVTFKEWSIALNPAKVTGGNVALKVTNAGKVPHGLYISGPGVDGKGNLLQPGASETQTRALDTGEYQIIDFVSSNETTHGMTATLVVE